MKYIIPLILLLSVPSYAEFAPAVKAHEVSTKNKNKDKYVFFSYVEDEVKTAVSDGQFNIELGVLRDHEKYVPELYKKLTKLGYNVEYKGYVLYLSW